jgi:hypothetical protein
MAGEILCVPVPSLFKNLRWYLLDARGSHPRQGPNHDPRRSSHVMARPDPERHRPSRAPDRAIAHPIGIASNRIINDARHCDIVT